MTTTTWTCWKNPAHTGVTPTVYGWSRCAECNAAPQYHERAQLAAHAGVTLTVYVPAPQSFVERIVAPRSAIVGTPSGERTTIAYEGWVHGAAQYKDLDARGQWRAGLEHAAGRLVSSYPSSAVATPKTSDLIAVGVYDVATRTVDITDVAAMEAWVA